MCGFYIRLSLVSIIFSWLTHVAWVIFMPFVDTLYFITWVNHSSSIDWCFNCLSFLVAVRNAALNICM